MGRQPADDDLISTIILEEANSHTAVVLVPTAALRMELQGGFAATGAAADGLPGNRPFCGGRVIFVEVEDFRLLQ